MNRGTIGFMHIYDSPVAEGCKLFYSATVSLEKQGSYFLNELLKIQTIMAKVI